MNFLRSIISRGWFQIAAGGIVLFVIVGQVLRYTENPTYLPTFIMLGSFIIPVAFATYFYRQEYLLDRNIHGGIPLIQASIMFLVGGAVGVVVAGLLESQLAFESDAANLLSIGAIEEAAKMVFPVVVFILARYRSEVDGLVFGISCGIGFAALETMGYGLITLMSFGTELSDLEQVLAVRGLLAPLGHAAWTGLICGTIWHYQNQGKKLVFMAIAYFILAVVLHTLWNIAASTGEAFIMYPGFVAIGSLGLFFVFRHLNHAKQKMSPANSESQISTG